jgi:hypothetical protein
MIFLIYLLQLLFVSCKSIFINIINIISSPLYIFL